VTIDDGIQIDRSDEQYENANSPRTESRQPGANVKCEMLSQWPKHDAEIVTIDDGIQID
jgi:hypothetical protein